MRSGEAAAAAARACVGARFRMQGRQRDYGYDCVGVAAAAYGIEVPADYALRFGDLSRLCASVRALGFREADGFEPGDLLVIRCGTERLHLAVRTAAGFVQAHLGLMRVVETPGWPAEPVVVAFRPEEG